MAKTGAVSQDVRLSRMLNQVPAALASVLTPLSHLFLPAGIVAVVVLTVGYVLVRNRGVLPVAAAAVAAGMAAGGATLLALAILLHHAVQAANSQNPPRPPGPRAGPRGPGMSP